MGSVDIDWSLAEQTSLTAEPNGVLKELLKHIHAQSASSFGQYAVVGDEFIKVVAQEPTIGQVNLYFTHEPAFGRYAIEIADEHGLEDDYRINGGLPGVTVVRFSKRINEREVNGGGYLTKKVIFRDKLIKGELVIEFRGEHSLPHHMAGISSLLKRSLPLCYQKASPESSSATVPSIVDVRGIGFEGQ